jgi:hypothetical protein
VSICSDDDTESTELDGEYYSEPEPDVDMRMEDEVDAQDSVNLDGDVDMERDGDDDEEDDEDEEKKDKEEVEEEDEDEEEDKDGDYGNEPRTIGQGEIVNTSADDFDSMGDDQTMVLPEQGQEICEHTPRLQPPACAPQP